MAVQGPQSRPGLATDSYGGHHISLSLVAVLSSCVEKGTTWQVMLAYASSRPAGTVLEDAVQYTALDAIEQSLLSDMDERIYGSGCWPRTLRHKAQRQHFISLRRCESFGGNERGHDGDEEDEPLPCRVKCGMCDSVKL